jgi:hypothetical protein
MTLDYTKMVISVRLQCSQFPNVPTYNPYNLPSPKIPQDHYYDVPKNVPKVNRKVVPFNPRQFFVFWAK